MAETAAQKKQREAKEAAKQKAQEEKAAAKKAEDEAAAQKKKEDEAAQAVAAKAQKDAQNTTDADKVKEAEERVGQNNDHLTKDEREAKGLKEIEEAKKNDVEDAPLVSTVHDDVVREKLAHASTSKAQRAQAEQYRLQQEHQKALETATQRGLGFNGVRPDGESEKDALV